MLFQCRTQHCVCRDSTQRLRKPRKEVFQCRTQHCVCRDQDQRFCRNSGTEFQCRTQHCVCRDTSAGMWDGMPLTVSIPHAALCVSRRSGMSTYIRCSLTFQCRTQHCVCRDAPILMALMKALTCFNAARSIVCVETTRRKRMSFPQKSFNAARSIVCVETKLNRKDVVAPGPFQCRTQHCVCRDFYE